ncbi:MAG: glycosyltransferase [Gammaproteobacteria bacterium]|nr:glycosyltransferase [Gammaproteobacteria bacterium]
MYCKELIIVTGMHRSGTSALTRLINLLGADLPGTLMPANEDNPKGYWESREITKLNNEILATLDSHWCDDRSLPVLEPVTDKYGARAGQLLKDFFRDSSRLTVKDPRFCRLLPIWLKAAKIADVDIKTLIITRHPLEVARSLHKRLDNRSFAPAAIVNQDKALLLWMRYVLEAEFYSRNSARAFLTYNGLLEHSTSLLVNSKRSLDLGIRDPAGEDNKAIRKFLDPALKHNHAIAESVDSHLVTEAIKIYKLFENALGENIPIATKPLLDNWLASLSEAESRYAPLRKNSAKQAHEDNIWLKQLAVAVPRRSLRKRPLNTRAILFVSGKPDSKGHIYRVENAIKALAMAGIYARWLPAAGAPPALAEEAAKYDAVIIFRAEWHESIRKLCDFCKSRSIPVGFDIDDLVFIKKYMTPLYFDYLRLLGKEGQNQWQEHAEGFRQTLLHADFVSVPTHKLMQEVLALGKPGFIIPNGFDDSRLAASAEYLMESRKPSQQDGCIRIGYASGTPTHQRDFETVSPALARIMTDYSQTRLVIVGELFLEEFPQLQAFGNRIEQRPAVPFEQLPNELHRFDINIAPLQIGNPFCEAKSELKYFEAAIVCVPTVASATQTMRDAISEGETGFCANGESEWYEKLSFLLNNFQKREIIGQRAKHHAIAAYDSESRCDILLSLLHSISEL